MRLFTKLFAELFSLALVAGVLLIAWSMKVVKLSSIDGERVFYLESASSQGLRKTELSVQDYANVKGESVTFLLDGKDGAETVEEILSLYNARVLLVEEVAGVRSYYCYTSRWKECIAVGGYAVNLHIALSAERCAVGTPIIFDGF